MASDHLSLGQNELVLQAYRRAMKCTFADVISVKRQLMEVKKLQKQQQQQQKHQQRQQQHPQQQQRDDVQGIDPSPVNSPSSTLTSDVELTKRQELPPSGFLRRRHTQQHGGGTRNEPLLPKSPSLLSRRTRRLPQHLSEIRGRRRSRRREDPSQRRSDGLGVSIGRGTQVVARSSRQDRQAGG
ncbi:hypothetical protein ACHAXS_000216, partial [Conticribra weissflogii]